MSHHEPHPSNGFASPHGHPQHETNGHSNGYPAGQVHPAGQGMGFVPGNGGPSAFWTMPGASVGWNGATPVGFPSVGFMTMPASYPPGVMSHEPTATDPSVVTIESVRPATPGTIPLPTQHNGAHTNGNGTKSPTSHRPTAPYAVANGTGQHGVTDLRLADLVVRAETSIDELQRLAATALDATAASTQAANDLQERLRLGVRMLQAFDVQIQRCEQTSVQVSSQLNGQVGVQMAAQFTNQIGAVTQQCELRMRSAVESLERRMNEALPFLDERLRQAHEQVGRIVDDRLTQAERAIEDRYGPVRDDLRRYADELATAFAKRLDSMLDEGVNDRLRGIVERAIQKHMGQMPAASLDPAALDALSGAEARIRSLLAEAHGRVEAMDASIRRADERLRSLIRESTEAADGLLGTLGTAGTLKDLIADEAQASRRLADEAYAAGREHQREIHDLLERCSIARSALDQQLDLLRETAAEADGRIGAAKALRGEIEETLHRMGPLESALRTDGNPIHSVVESISSNVRQALAEDMRNFSQALRGLAARAEHAFAPARFDEFSPMPESIMTTPSPMAFEPLDAFAEAMPASEHTSAATDGTLLGLNGNPATDAHAGHLSSLPLDTRRLTAEVMALDATSLLRQTAPTRHGY
jgi:hypothetical protein